MYKILLIEDNVDHQELIINEIQETYDNKAHITVSSTLYGGLSTLTQQKFEIILFDLNLPDSKANNTIEEINNLKLDIPVIALTSLNNTEHARTLLSNGVQDYLSKDKLSPDVISKSFFYSIERKSFEKKMQQEIEEKEIFCFALSHDFRGPIRRIESFSKILLEDSEMVSEKNKSHLNVIQSQCFQLQSLINELQSYINIEFGESSISPVNLNLIINKIKEANADLFKDRSVKLVNDELPVISGLNSNLYLLFENLILNAIKHNDKTPEINISVTRLESSLRIEISDNGMGIEDYFVDNIFLPFKKKHRNNETVGSGLGLAIAKKIVQQHQGSIGVETSFGAGSVFFIELPNTLIIGEANI